MINSTALLKAYTTWVFTNVGIVRSVLFNEIIFVKQHDFQTVYCLP